MYNYVWLCNDHALTNMTLYEFLWLCMTMYDYVWQLITMYDYVWLMYD